jgi:hypothetical protein
VPIAFGFLSVMLGQDANWDLRNYHWYNAYAFLTRRLGFDMVPAQTPTFYNPTLDLPLYLIADKTPPWVAGFLLGVVHGLNFIPLFWLSYTILIIKKQSTKVVISAAIALMGLVGGGAFSQVGTTFYETTTSLGFFSALTVVAIRLDTIIKGCLQSACLWSVLAGFLVGSASGLKQPSVIFCLGLCSAFLFLTCSPIRRLGLAFMCGVGIIFGIAAFSGHWMWHLWTTYNNPLFPYLNNIFQSPLAQHKSYRDTNFIPERIHEQILLPFYFPFDWSKVGEEPFFDLRIPILFMLLPSVGLIRLISGCCPVETIAKPAKASFIITTAVLSYVAWLWMFCIYRYAIALEMLAPLLIVLSIALLPLTILTRWIVALTLLVSIQISTRPANWGRVAWGTHWIEAADMPNIPNPDRTMILMGGYEPFSHIVSLFPPQIPFIRIQSNFTQPQQIDNHYNDLMRMRVSAHEGPLYMMSTPSDRKIADEALNIYGLQISWESCTSIHPKIGKEISFCAVRSKIHDQ